MSLSCLSRVKRINGCRPLTIELFTDNVFVGDRSGSMGSMGSIPQKGCVNFMNDHKELAKNNQDSNVNITMWAFDNISKKYYSGDAININEQDIKTAIIEMRPHYTTRLYDTAIEAIYDQQHRIENIYASFSREVAKLTPKVAVTFTLLTDGEDNESMNTSYDMKCVIENHRRKYGAVCVFAAANQDAMYSGEQYGFHQDNSLQIGNNVDEAEAAFRSCTNVSLRSATRQSTSYTQAERDQSFSYNHVDYEIDNIDNTYNTDNIGVAMRC
jgi:hypothetical protein